MRRLRSDEGGWALVTAVMFMAFMLATSLALSQYMDSLTTQSGITRVRETSFNAAESALTSQVTSLTSQGWPQRLPWPTCTPASTDARCPSAAAMQGLHSSADTLSGLTWTTTVKDDVGGASDCTGSYYDDAALQSAPAYDANLNDCLWIRTQARVRDRTRTLVALVRSQRSEPTLPPDYAVYAGRIDFDSNAVKEFVTDGKLATRCTPVMGEQVPCAGYPLGTSKARTVADLQASYSASVGSTDAEWGVNEPTMTQRDRDRWKAFAQENGTYYTSCPPSIDGPIVWIEGNLSCSYSGTSTYNSSASPGLLVVNGGTLQLGGTVQFYGVIYFPNPNNVSTKVFDETGNPTVYGSVFADGNALVNVGTSGTGNIVYSRAAFEATRLPSTAGVVQNTWRELPPNTVVP